MWYQRRQAGEANFSRFEPRSPSEALNMRLSRRFDIGATVPWPGNKEFRAATLYTRKADKVHPVDRASTQGDTPGGETFWKDTIVEREKELGLHQPRGHYDRWILPSISGLARGARITPEREEKLKIGEILWPREREFPMEMLYNREAVLAWDWEHVGRVQEG